MKGLRLILRFFVEGGAVFRRRRLAQFRGNERLGIAAREWLAVIIRPLTNTNPLWPADLRYLYSVPGKPLETACSCARAPHRAEAAAPMRYGQR
jgi:hypothetical protein